MRVLLDTGVLADILEGAEKSRQLFESIREGRVEAFVSALTVAELLGERACSDAGTRELTEGLLSLMVAVEIDGETARLAAECRRKTGLALHECIIAASARRIKAVIYTRNPKKFSRLGAKAEAPY